MKKKIFEKYLFFAFFVLIFFLVVNFLNGNYFAHDTLDFFNAFHYLSEYKRQFNELPFWISDLNSGHIADYLFLNIGSLGIFFSSIFSILNNDFFIFYCILFIINALFIYGVFLNFKSSKNEKKIFLLIIFFYFSYTSINRQISFENIFTISVPYLIYFSQKFLKDYKISNITLMVTIVFLQFTLSYSYIIIANIYFILFYLVCFFIYFFINNYEVKKIFINNSWTSYIYLFISVIIFFFYAKYLLSNIPFYGNTAGRSGVNVSFGDFLTYGEFGKKNFISSIIIGNADKNFDGCCFSDYNPNLGPYLLISMYIFFINLKYFISRDKFYFLLIFFTGLIYFIFSFRLEFKDKLLYMLPYMSMYRHLDYTHVLLKALLLIFMGKIFVKWYEDFNNLNFSLKYFLLVTMGMSLLLIIIIYKYSGANISIKKIIFIIIFNYLAIYSFYKFFKSKAKKYLYSILILCFATYIINTNQFFYFNKTLNEKNFYKNTFNSKIEFIENNVSNCLQPNTFLEKYRKAFHYHPYTEVYGLVEVMLNDRPCSRTFRWNYNNSIKTSDSDLEFYSDVKKIRNTYYIIQNIKGHENINLKISFDKNWKLIDKSLEHEKYNIVNNNGYIQINLQNSLKKNSLIMEYNPSSFQKNFIKINILLVFIYLFLLIYICINYVKMQKN
jgi:hypothetical protein